MAEAPSTPVTEETKAETPELPKEETSKVGKSEQSGAAESSSGVSSTEAETKAANGKTGEGESKEADASNDGKGEGESEAEVLELTKEELDTVLQSECIFGDVAFYNQIMGMMSGSLKQKLAEIKDDPEDPEVIWKCAHSVKGTALQCSLEKLANAAKDLERAYRNPENDDISKRPQFTTTFEREAQRVLNSASKLPDADG